MMNPDFLNSLATYTHSKIEKVVINEVHEIIEFEVKSQQSNEVKVEYLVPFNLVETVTKIELKDQSDQVVTTNNVFVPITSDTLLKHNFLIQEG
ncbi:ketopantoate hydroxymethyltransferase [Jeotgalibacillus malaysiensis]|uniref:ketopantoate hydroxymethyltransferase n=1 Tax=Jeotgalibacillus malaysiensis TaxID=1508404 RepID=UPI00384FC7B0